jgi:hypothetical protein
MDKIIKLIDGNFSEKKGISLNLPTPVEWLKNGSEYDISIYTDGMAFNQEINPEKINCIWLLEPPIINGEHQFNAIKNYQNFRYIFSPIKELSKSIDNYVFVPAGGTWLREEDIKIFDKTKIVSTIFSWKTWNNGHRLRHSIYNMFKDSGKIDFYGSGCDKPIDFKIEGLKDYRFSVVIENSIESDYFTEKLLDCFLTGTIPIYWGTKNIENYFDTNGVIFINDENELLSIINILDVELYNSKINSIQSNFELSKKYIHPEKIIDTFLKNNVK